MSIFFSHLFVIKFQQLNSGKRSIWLAVWTTLLCKRLLPDWISWACSRSNNGHLIPYPLWCITHHYEPRLELGLTDDICSTVFTWSAFICSWEHLMKFYWKSAVEQFWTLAACRRGAGRGGAQTRGDKGEGVYLKRAKTNKSCIKGKHFKISDTTTFQPLETNCVDRKMSRDWRSGIKESRWRIEAKRHRRGSFQGQAACRLSTEIAEGPGPLWKGLLWCLEEALSLTHTHQTHTHTPSGTDSMNFPASGLWDLSAPSSNAWKVVCVFFWALYQ